jgi:biopolymer transport protein ExbD
MMMIYILKVTACLAIFYTFYKLFLENESMHNFKRFYLLAALVSAFIIPTILFTEYIYIEPAPIVESLPLDFPLEEFGAPPIPKNTNYLSAVLWTIYGMGVLVFGFQFCQNLLTIRNRIRKNPKIKNLHLIHVLLQEKLVPHTFFNFIFLNKQKFDAHEIPTPVLLHEHTHALQKHSIDVLFIELLQVFLWFNPFIYLFKKVIKLNHEFLADQAVMQKGVEITTYQKILLAFSSNATNPETALTNAINYSSIKKRFTVMKKNTSKKALWLRSLLVLPLFALVLYGFSETKILEVEKPHVNDIKSKLKKAILPQVNYTKNEVLKISEDIEIHINEVGIIFLKDKEVKLEHLKERLLNYNSNFTFEERKNQVAIRIKIDNKIDATLFHKGKEILDEYGYATINLLGSELEVDDSNLQSSLESYKQQDSIGFIKDWFITIDGKKYYYVNDKNGGWKYYDSNKMEVSLNIVSEYQKKQDILKKLTSTDKHYIDKTAKEQQVMDLYFSDLGGMYFRMSRANKNKVTRPISPYAPYLRYERDGEIVFKKQEDLTEDEKAYLAKKFPPPPPAATNQDGATKKQISEYNSLANKYNYMNSTNLRIKKSEVERMEYLYNLMTDEQKKSAASYPEIPPIPAPPLPPSPTKFEKIEKDMEHQEKTLKQQEVELKKQEKTLKEQEVELKQKETSLIAHEKALKIQKLKLKKQESELNTLPIPRTPPKPISPLDHIIEMAKKDATFYYEDEAISADKAIELLKKNKTLNIDSKGSNNDKPVVRISKKPIAAYEKESSNKNI